MTEIKIVELQKIEDGALLIGHKVTVTHDNEIREKICHYDTLYGDTAWAQCVISDNTEDTDWIETLPLVKGKKTEWLHKTYIYNSFEEFDKASWCACQTRSFIWDCEDEFEED